MDGLTPEEEKDRLSSDEVVDNFWKYCAEREEEERILAEADETEKKKEHKVLHYFQKHQSCCGGSLAVLIVIMLGGSWQMAVNAEKHGGFFWWMDKNEERTTMITSPEVANEDSERRIRKNYYSIEDVPEKYKTYVSIPYEIIHLYEKEYYLDRIETVKADESDTVYEFFSKDKDELLVF